MKGETEQANRLARWLRRITDAARPKLKLEDLAERFGHGAKTKWGHYLDGRRIIPEEALRALVADEAFVSAPLRGKRLEQGLQLRREAVEAEEGRQRQGQLAHRRSPRTADEVALRLDDARKGQLRAERATFTAQQTVEALLRLVGLLQERIALLKAERRKSTPGLELQQELGDSQNRLDKAQELLAEARREREQAEEIRLATVRLVEQHRQALADMEAAPEAPPADNRAPDDEPATAAEQLGLEPLYEVDYLLEASEERLTEQATQLDELSEELGLARSAEVTQPEGPDVIPVEVEKDPGVVRDEGADNADKPSTSDTETELSTEAAGEAEPLNRWRRWAAGPKREFTGPFVPSRRPLSPLGAGLPGPVREFTEEVRRIYWHKTQLKQSELATRLHIPPGSMPGYLNGQKIMNADMIADLSRAARLTPYEEQRLTVMHRDAAKALRSQTKAQPRADREPRDVNYWAVFGLTAAIAVLAVIGYLLAVDNGQEVEPVYDSGDKPKIDTRSSHFTWSATHTGVSTTFKLDDPAWPYTKDDELDRIEATLTMSLSGNTSVCARAVEWKLKADGKQVATDVMFLEEEGKEEKNSIDAELPPNARSITLTAERTGNGDGEPPCDFKTTLDSPRIYLAAPNSVFR